LKAIAIFAAGSMVAIKRFIADIVVASKDSIAVAERYIIVTTGDGTEAAIVDIEIGLDRGLFRYERFVEKPVSPYR
jgi:hypothetical protein